MPASNSNLIYWERVGELYSSAPAITVLRGFSGFLGVENKAEACKTVSLFNIGLSCRVVKRGRCLLRSLIITKNVASKSPKGDNTLLGSIPLLLVPTSLRLCGHIWLLGDTPTNSASSVPLLFYIVYFITNKMSREPSWLSLESRGLLAIALVLLDI